jgi:RNA-splicing ligase RtcB
VALMADHHKGYAVPIGGVVAYEDAISPSGVGYDIACGNKAVLTDAPANEVRRNIKVIMDDICRTISFGVGRNNNERVEHPLFDADHSGWHTEPAKNLKRMAENQLGTVGSGNHYVDIFEDEKNRIWVGVHFGSRGLGHKTATYFLKAAAAKNGMDVKPCMLPVGSDLGTQYLEAMKLAGEYAYAGRNWACARVASLLGASILEEVQITDDLADQGVGCGTGFRLTRQPARRPRSSSSAVGMRAPVRPQFSAPRRGTAYVSESGGLASLPSDLVFKVDQSVSNRGSLLDYQGAQIRGEILSQRVIIVT